MADLENSTKFGQLILSKIIKIVATSCQISSLKCTKFDFGCGSAPDPTGGAYSAPQTPELDLRGATSKGREGREGLPLRGAGKEGWRGRERGDGRKGEGWGEKGRGEEGEGRGRVSGFLLS